ncbi:MAG: IS3 family transposase [Halothermotrichaceae bacterium]
MERSLVLEKLTERIVEYIEFYNEKRFQKKIRIYGSVIVSRPYIPMCIIF